MHATVGDRWRNGGLPPRQSLHRVTTHSIITTYESHQRLVRRRPLPNGSARSFLALPGILKNCRDVIAELFGQPHARAVNIFDGRVTISWLRSHLPPFLPACK